MSRRAFATKAFDFKHGLLKTDAYQGFEKINGKHPLQESVPAAYLLYKVRKLEKGRVSFFNFDLAREMGLISEGHPSEMNSQLEKMVLNTFCLQIINEFDEQSGRKFDPSRLKAHPYMATRYLQLQHSNKQGKTSGDGRSIWNGTIKHKGITWDVSSRGTGVTTLAPGAVEANRPLKTGEEEFGYGCGLADIDELYGSALMSEIFHRQGLQTERVLAVIDIGSGLGIGVRASPNLLRPAHMFLYLKQARHKELAAITNYFMNRQLTNSRWDFKPGGNQGLDAMLELIAKDFAKFAAHLERNYIFVWIDWDGDNLLADAGIIDYGSVRQFGLRHDQYRYDDVQRFSTNLNEQKIKARDTIKTFCQLVAFLKTKKKHSISYFQNHWALKTFDREFEKNLRLIFLQQIGLTPVVAEKLFTENRKSVESLYQSFSILERTKTRGSIKKLPDGVNLPAIYNMRTFLREYPALLRSHTTLDGRMQVSPEDIFSIIQSQFAGRKDQRLRQKTKLQITNLQKSYAKILQLACGEKNLVAFLADLETRSSKANRADRITGNSIEYLVSAVLKAQKSGMSFAEVQTAVDHFIRYQSPSSSERMSGKNLINIKSPAGKLLQKLIDTCVDFSEDI